MRAGQCPLEDGCEVGDDVGMMGEEHGEHQREETPALERGEGGREGGRVRRGEEDRKKTSSKCYNTHFLYQPYLLHNSASLTHITGGQLS